MQSMVEGQLSEALTLSGNLRSTVSSSGAPGVGETEPQVDPAAVDDRVRTLCGLLMAVGSGRKKATWVGPYCSGRFHPNAVWLGHGCGQ
eukprot:scaffold77437_cov20-Tisochrysis_lutea.AAC.1